MKCNKEPQASAEVTPKVRFFKRSSFMAATLFLYLYLLQKLSVDVIGIHIYALLRESSQI